MAQAHLWTWAGGHKVAASPRKPLPPLQLHKPFWPALLIKLSPRSFACSYSLSPLKASPFWCLRSCSATQWGNWSETKLIIFVGLFWWSLQHASTRNGCRQRTGKSNRDWKDCSFEQCQRKGVWKQVRDQSSIGQEKGWFRNHVREVWWKQIGHDHSLFLRWQKFKYPVKLLSTGFKTSKKKFPSSLCANLRPSHPSWRPGVPTDQKAIWQIHREVVHSWL